MGHTPLIAPSLLAADFGCLREEASSVVLAGADWLHIDIMDGRFVPNISFGPQIIRMLRASEAKTLLDVHLMIVEPERYLAECAAAGADYLTVHLESCVHLQRTVQQIKELGCQAGVALNPHTSPEALQYVLADLDLVLVMSVNPGFGGQKFLPLALDKLRRLRACCAGLEKPPLLQVDGGVNATNAALLAEAGADVLVAGTAVFGEPDYAAAIKRLRL